MVLKKSDNLMIYPRVYEVNDIYFKAHWGSGSHLSIESTIEVIKGLEYRWDKMDKMQENYFIDEKFVLVEQKIQKDNSM